MALSFPPNPNVGDQYLSYVFDGIKWGVQAGVGGVAGVSSLNTRTGSLTLLLSDVTGATGSGSAAQSNLGLATVASSGAYADVSGKPTIPAGTSMTPAMDGIAAAGIDAAFARADHVHPTDTSRYDATNPAGYQTAANLAAAVAPYGGNAGRNLLHNSMFNVQQRGRAGWSTSGSYTADRWQLLLSGSTTTLNLFAVTAAHVAMIGDESAIWHLANTVTGTAGAGDYVSVVQRIEDVRRLAGKTVTVSFWGVAPASPKKLGVNLSQLFGTGGSPAATVNGTGQLVQLTTTYARYSLTFAVPSVAGLTLGTNGDHSTQLAFWYSSGATNAAQAGNVGVQSGGINIWGVQLEVGSAATPLEKPDPQQDLAKCQRFFQTLPVVWWGYQVTAGSFGYTLALPVTMRASPTCTFANVGNANIGTVTAAAQSPGTAYCLGAVTATGPAIINGTITASADL